MSDIRARQCNLFGEPEPHFDGDTIEAADVPRLSGHLERVAKLMRDGRWRTLQEIAEHVECSEASASARLRDLRKPRFGGHRVDRRRHAGRPGLWSYRVEAA